MKKKIVYIAHPIGAINPDEISPAEWQIEQNLKAIQTAYREITASFDNVVPFVPYYAAVCSLNDSSAIERKLGFSHNEAIFKSGIIDELWLYGDRISAGMLVEIGWAKELGILIVSKSEGTRK